MQVDTQEFRLQELQLELYNTTYALQTAQVRLEPPRSIMLAFHFSYMALQLHDVPCRISAAKLESWLAVRPRTHKTQPFHHWVACAAAYTARKTR